MAAVPAPDARAASTKSSPRTWVVAVSATRHNGGMNTRVSASMPFAVPPPIAPAIATASSTEGKA
jgi:hypothetical protein